MSDQQDRRFFKRVNFDNRGQLSVGKHRLECTLLDLSLKGALIKLNSPIDLKIGEKGSLSFDLGDSQHVIIMEVEISHCDNSTLGMHCLYIDVDSISHLRRIIELNTGDPDILQRELQALVNP